MIIIRQIAIANPILWSTFRYLCYNVFDLVFKQTLGEKMTMKIKYNYNDNNDYYIVMLALEAGGCILNGATNLNINGNYDAPHPGVDFNKDTFILSDKWFNNEKQDIGTVEKAAERATGIRLKFASQMLSSESATILSYEIVNQKQYNDTVGTHMNYKKNERLGGGQGLVAK